MVPTLELDCPDGCPFLFPSLGWTHLFLSDLCHHSLTGFLASILHALSFPTLHKADRDVFKRQRIAVSLRAESTLHPRARDHEPHLLLLFLLATWTFSKSLILSYSPPRRAFKWLFSQFPFTHKSPTGHSPQPKHIFSLIQFPVYCLHTIWSNL